MPAGTGVPNYWDSSHRYEKPNLSEIRRIRFLTEADNPPFSFIGADGNPTGFLVDLTRALCEEIPVQCTLQPMRWDVLLQGIERGLGDAIISTMAIDRAPADRFIFTNRFLARPARFVARRGTELRDATPETLAGRSVGVVARTAHEAYLRDLFPEAGIAPFETAEEAREALRGEKVDLVFGDGINLSLWLNGAVSGDCCRFVGGPFTESRYFGEGLAIAVAPEGRTLLRALDFALARVHRSGEYEEIYRRHFPISFY
ncbi:extracellular solute-binding protein, family 3 [Lutibaculum baratangense AMV1]|uniref:Extracellular solute-binding protein, family 3 n=1 Tax=Lutibaculum baratangense AMV1 TaxID=631454 RepID=V4TJR0_9HYPH|nr:extracellular solute-binding protein, family 3 [Lutibaculum baratangense AMV1]